MVFRAHPPAAQELLGDEQGQIARFVVQSGLGTALVSMRNTLAPIALGVVSTPTQVGYFRAAQAPVTGLEALSAPVRLILLTEQTRDVEHGLLSETYRSLRRYVLGASAFVLVLAPVAWVLMPWLVRVILGADFEPATDAARILLLAACLRLVLGWTKTFPVSIGRPGLRIVAHGVEIAVLIPLLLVLGARWDATGAAVAMLVATVAFAIAWAVLLARLRREPLPPRVGDALSP
jgi:O-antigen/teichoic acid export membrane protein